MKGDHIGEFEEFVLLAVRGLKAEAYGVRVQQLLEGQMSRTVSLGAVYAALDRLETKGFVTSAIVPGTETRGGRSRREFQPTAEGARMLAALQRIREQLYRVGKTRGQPSRA